MKNTRPLFGITSRIVVMIDHFSRTTGYVVASLIVIFGVSLSGLEQAQAGIIYDESVSGDLDSSFDGNTLQLSAGSNTILGSSSFNTDTSVFDLDRFTLLLGGGLGITQVDITFSNLVPGTVTSLLGKTELRVTGSPNTLYFRRIQTVWNNFVNTTTHDDLPLFDASILGGVLPSQAAEGACDSGCTFDYTLTYVVVYREPVPEPGTLAMLGLGLLGMSITCRRRSRALAWRG